MTAWPPDQAASRARSTTVVTVFCSLLDAIVEQVPSLNIGPPARSRCKGAASGRLAGDPALGYFLTFRCYGTWLHGDDRGSTDRTTNSYGAPFLQADARRLERETSLLRHPPVALNAPMRAVVEAVVQRECSHRGWVLYTLNVRSNHVHVVLTADEPPERVMNVLKSWATKALVESGLLPKGVKAWSRHGSTKYLWDERAVEDACTYVSNGQGDDLHE